ncbi:hypothetical protein EXVG_00346 [Emiliania huxleyi virus 202]|nr:hypothetical protein EXVG_00346 [Emiliania huxleyi virus 202]
MIIICTLNFTNCRTCNSPERVLSEVHCTLCIINPNNRNKSRSCNSITINCYCCRNFCVTSNTFVIINLHIIVYRNAGARRNRSIYNTIVICQLAVR